MNEIIVIDKRVGIERDKTRVAAYCRVSTDQPGQEESFDTQVQYYQKMISQNPRWEFAGVYADKGVSGTSAEHRPEFMRLMEDAFAGHIDIIFTKSISRFARNVVDCQTYTRKLKELGVEVRFEREQISNMDPTADFIFSILSAIAQEESHSLSENMRWRYKQNFMKGIYRLGNNRILGYDMDEDGKLIPNLDAWIVSHVFNGYSQGKGLTELAKELNTLGVKTNKSGKQFTSNRIFQMLQNERYVGDTLLQKKPPKDYLTKTPQIGIPYKSYYIKNSHQGIVSREVWDRVQSRLADQKKLWDNKIYICGDHVHFLYGILYCGRCGALYTRRTVTTRKNTYYKAWNCRERQKGKNGNGCKNSSAREEVILQKIAEALGTETFCKDAFDEHVDKVIVTDGDVRVIPKKH
ncbi:MAG TPA: recombinase family protein [Bacillota bacterium]|nr:recombinase family protein [Bacillota bacterium]